MSSLRYYLKMGKAGALVMAATLALCARAEVADSAESAESGASAGTADRKSAGDARGGGR